MSTTASLPDERRLLTTLVGLALALVVSVLVVPPVARAGVAVCNVDASATSVMVGDQVTFTGTGFAPNTLISVAALANGVPFGAAGGPTDSAGTFVYTIGLPVVGTWLVTFTQENACSDSTTVTVTCAPDVDASATSVMVGDQVTFTGTGFAPNTLISVAALANGVPFGAAGGPTDSAGTFVYTIGLPVVGTWLVTFTQENACSDSTTVTVGAAGTSAPAPSGLPDAAMSTPPASGPALVVTLLVWLLLLVFAGAAARRA